MVHRRHPCHGFLLALLLLGYGAMAQAEEHEHDHEHHHEEGDLILFPALTYYHNSKTVSGQVQDKLQPEVNVFYSTGRERWRFLAEFLVRDTEQEMERLQAGWLATPELTVWGGRFHSPYGFWNTEHHHGAYLQTTITRPSIVAFEDEGGVVPSHITGVLADGFMEREHGQINYSAGLGIGPVLENDGLEPLNVLNPQKEGKHAAVVRVSYRPATDDLMEFGASFAHTRIPITKNGSVFDRNDQTVVGAFYTLDTERFRLLGEAFHVSNHLSGPGGSPHPSFNALYLQPEYRIRHDWTVYGRLETSSHTRNDPYLDLQPDFLTARLLAGAKIAIGRNQALKVELSHNEKQDTTRFGQISLQWSLIWP